MRRGVGVVLVGLGAFLIVLAPLLRFQVADKLVQAPADQYSVTKLTAENARYFSLRDLKVLTGKLDITVTTRGDVKEAKDDHVVWDQFINANDVTNNNPQISMTQFRGAFNKYNGQGVTCCGVSVDSGSGAEPVQLRGQIHLFPFGVEKKTYLVFNANTRKAFDATFDGEDTVNGLPVYRFVQRIPPTPVEKLTAPASVLGMKGNGDIQVDRVYDAVITFWVEPTTGVPVKQEQQRHEVLKTADGVERMPALIATASFTPESVSDLVQTARDNIAQITLIKTTLPLVSLILGIALAVVGVWLRRPGRAD
ncbi:hypothetical protein GCM10010116_23790 [Microbispora rosea subsp. aerata]|nr:DUF3068 domain-containing protein [Microbispora rosea]GGO11854.1 hypothetical protein GCM10010116_23790 [Microbispora rosea subsp. aerata]GIH55692.1 hypothetical protein Mro02_26060 [Microbispora rosea subsp. aerata]GLJ86010.1 hypothetical protein GCM10017588_47430 [Microbispora rosea subsp. aerata]